MGIGTFVEPQTTQQRPSARGIDMPLLVIVVALIVFGLAMLYSASWDFSRAAYDGDAMYMFNRQVMWLGLGVVGATVLAFLDYHRWRQLIVPAMAVTVLMLIAVLVMSEVRFNAQRAIFNGSIQPSELAKLVSIAAAGWRSITVTSWPASCRYQAVVTPVTPAPRTITFMRNSHQV